ncbi:MAG TPA: hypothetical protein VHD86_18350 [Xanthobacteraceae bacterium]|nr:hypothetical protein [Xanthobacteraceae bacterium]
MATTALFVRVPAVSPEIEAGWSAWYDASHIDYRMHMPGFIVARRYVMQSGRHRVLALYEMNGPEAMTTPEYLALRRWEGERPAGAYERIAPNLPGFERGLYEELVAARQSPTAYDAPFIYVVGHHPQPEEEAAFEDWQSSTAADAAGRIAGVAAVRRFRQLPESLAPNSGTRTPHPLYFTVIYLDSDAVAAMPAFAELLTSGQKKARAPASVMLGRRVHTATAHKATPA